MSIQSRRPMTRMCKGPHQPASLTPRVAYCLSLGWSNNPKGQSREEKTNTAQPWQCCVNFRSFSSLIPHWVLSYSEECLQQGLLGEQEASSLILTEQSPPIHLTSAHAFKDFSLHAPLTPLPLLAQGPLHHFALRSVYYLNSSDVWFFLLKVETVLVHGLVEWEEFDACIAPVYPV